MSRDRIALAIGTVAYVVMWFGCQPAHAFFADSLRRIIDWYLPWW